MKHVSIYLIYGHGAGTLSNYHYVTGNDLYKFKSLVEVMKDSEVVKVL